MISFPRPILRAAAVASTLLLAAACGPDPAEIDRSPVAGMTAENPNPGRITGEDIEEDLPNQGTLQITGVPEAAPAREGVVEVSCALEGYGDHQTLTAILGTGAGGGRLQIEVEDYHGDGDYDAHLELSRQGEDGAYLESEGTGVASLHKGTLLNTDAATHWISGTFEGSFQGEAGDGQASGSFERCFYFK